MQIVRNATASVGQMVASALIMFVLYRTILDILGVKQLGIWSVVLATTTASRIGELGLSASVTRFVAKYRSCGDDETVGHVIQTAFISIAVLFTLALIPAYYLLDALFQRIFEGEAIVEALALLPYALISIVLASVGGVFQSGLDGCQRYVWRAFLVIFGQLLFLLGTLWFAPRYGLVGIAWAQIGQSVVMVVLGWLLIRRLLPRLPFIPRHWQWSSFREMLSYGLQFQVGSVAMMLFDPVTKVLLAKYGGLSATGYYEMASQVVTKTRALIVSANQVLVPVMAGLNELNMHLLQDLYRTNLRWIYFFALPLFALVAAWAPLLSEYWIGYYEPKFVFFVYILVLAWGIATVNVPAYFSNMGTGRIVWNTVAHVWMGMANVSLGILLGQRYGMVGVVLGMAFSLITSSVVIIVGFHRENHISRHILLPKESILPIVASLILVFSGYYAYHALVDAGVTVRFLLCILLPVPILGPILWIHPLRTTIQAHIYVNLGKEKNK